MATKKPEETKNPEEKKKPEETLAAKEAREMSVDSPVKQINPVTSNTDAAPQIIPTEKQVPEIKIAEETGKEYIREETPQIQEDAPDNRVIEKEIPDTAYMHDKEIWPDGEIKKDNFSPLKTSELNEVLLAQATSFDREARTNVESPGTFTYEGKKFKVLLPQVNIPDIGIVTALDILSDTAAQEYLVKNKTHGSVIQEVIE